jgi:hypothetical protein
LADQTTVHRNDELRNLIQRGAAVSTAYLDVSADRADPISLGEGRAREVVDALARAGAPEADRDVIARELEQPTGHGGATTRYLLAHDGRLVISETFTSGLLLPDAAAYGDMPDLVPLIRHRAADVRYLVVETGREGGTIELVRAQHAQPVGREEHIGATDSLPKVQAGGWSHSRYQRHSEETWKHNQSDVANAVDDAVRRFRPRFVVVAGDGRAVQLLMDDLGEGARAIATSVASHVRAEGASSEALDRHVDELLASLGESEVSSTVDRMSARDGELGVTTLGEVVHALQQAQVDTLILALRELGDRTLLALDDEPWIAVSPEEAVGERRIETVPAASALVRAALMTDARVLFADDEPFDDIAGTEDSRPEPTEDEDEPRPQNDLERHPILASGAVAFLRWPVGPPVPAAGA